MFFTYHCPCLQALPPEREVEVRDQGKGGGAAPVLFNSSACLPGCDPSNFIVFGLLRPRTFLLGAAVVCQSAVCV